MTLPFMLIDAFADGALRGNPAGVVLLEEPLPDPVLQEAANEVSHPETAFLLRQGDRWSLKWMTPTVEVDLCGHATLAAAAALVQWRHADPEAPIRFDTRSGELVVHVSEEGSARMDFPADPPQESELPLEMAPRPVWTGRTNLDWFAELPSAQHVLAFRPDMATIASAGLRGLVITARGEEEDDVCSRFFAPQSGVPEDGATGSAHCGLGPYWAEKLGRSPLRCLQASPRGARLIVEPRGGRVTLAGQARVRIMGEIRLSDVHVRPS